MNAKKNLLANIITSLVIGVLAGVAVILLSTFLDVSFLIKWGLIIAGIIVIISNIPALINGALNAKKMSGVVDLIFAALGIVLGCMMIFVQGTVITVLVSVYLIAFPIIRILLSGAWRDQIKKEWLRILIGILLLAFLPALLSAADTIVKTVILVTGCVIIGLSVLMFALSLYSYLTALKKVNESQEFFETSAEDSNNG